MYAVVLFKLEQSVEVVPTSWITSTAKDMCVWPPLKGINLTRAVERRAPPEATWQMYEVEALRETGNYCMIYTGIILHLNFYPVS